MASPITANWKHGRDPPGETFDSLSLRIKQLEGRMVEVAQLKTHIINYSKTRDIYKEYKKSRHKKEYRAEHADEIKKHEAAKAAFDALREADPQGGATVRRICRTVGGEKRTV